MTTDETAAVRQLWTALGLDGIVDVHTHFMPRSVLDKVWSYFDAAGPLVGRPWPIAYRHSEQERVERLRAFGVRAFTSMLYPHKPDMAAWLNAWAVDFASHTPDCLHTATFFPEQGAGDIVARGLEQGARVFKAHVQVGGYDPTDPLLEPVWGLLAESGTPVVIHCGSGPVPGAHTGPEPVREVLRRHPRLALVIAHLGMPEYAEFLELAATHERVHLDTTMALTDFTDEIMPLPADLVPRLRDVGDRILWGSDFPNIPYSYLHPLERLAALDLGDDWLRGVLHDNAARLFELDA